MGAQCAEQPGGRLAQRAIGADLLRPARLAKYRVMGHRHDTRIDQRPAAQPIGDQRRGVLTQAQVEQTVPHAARLAGPGCGEAGVSGQIGQAGRKHTGQVFPATFQHTHPQRFAVGAATAGQCGSRNRRAVTTANDHHIEVGLAHIGERWRRRVGRRSQGDPGSLGDQGFEPLRQPGGPARVFVRFRLLRVKLHRTFAFPDRPLHGWRAPVPPRSPVCAAGASPRHGPRAGAPVRYRH